MTLLALAVALGCGPPPSRGDDDDGGLPASSSGSSSGPGSSCGICDHVAAICDAITSCDCQTALPPEVEACVWSASSCQELEACLTGGGGCDTTIACDPGCLSDPDCGQVPIGGACACEQIEGLIYCSNAECATSYCLWDSGREGYCSTPCGNGTCPSGMECVWYQGIDPWCAFF